jgi:hypothetical protein
VQSGWVWVTMNEEQKARIETVAMDMWGRRYVNSVCAHLPAAEHKIVFDKLHIAKHLGKPSITCGARSTGC